MDRVLARQPWAELRRVLAVNEIPDREATLRRLKRYVEILVQWNRSVSNLISKNDEERIVVAHVLPSIEHCGWMRGWNLAKWCDLGSGGGFPAIPLAICGVGEAWDLVESRRTKTLFLQRAVGELKLKNVRVLASRIEDLIGDRRDPLAAASAAESGNEAAEGGHEAADGGHDAADGGRDAVEEPRWGSEHDAPRFSLSPPYDGFTSRATLSLGPTLAYAAAIVRGGGGAFLWKGSKFAEEAASSPEWRDAWEEVESRPLSIEHSVVVSLRRINK